MGLNTKQLQSFLLVIEHRSIAGAARQLDIAQPALSQQISKLEHELKTTLFVRDHKGVQLTEAGEKFEHYCRIIVNQLDRAVSDINDVESDPQGKVVIAMGPAQDNLLSMPLFTTIAKKFPKINLEVRSGLSFEVIDLLSSGAADLAIASGEGLDPNKFNRELLFTEQLFFVESNLVPRDHVSDIITFAELADYEISIATPKDEMGRLIQHHEILTGVKLNKQAPFGELMTSLRLAIEGHIRLILPSSAYCHIVEHEFIKSRKIVEPEIFNEVYIATNAHHPIRNVVLRIIEVVKQCTYDAHREGMWVGTLPD